MTDELERLLREGQEEPEQVAEVLNLRVTEYSAAREERPVPAEAGEELPAARFGESEPPFFSHQVRSVDGEEELRRENSARTLYRTLIRTGRAARGAGQPRENSPVPPVRQSTLAENPGRDALWLDRIFQRDARRYDGGFTWQ